MNKPSKPHSPREEPPDQREPYELPPPPSEPDPSEPPRPQQDPPPDEPERDGALCLTDPIDSRRTLGAELNSRLAQL
jgi:hypothetical protein